MVRDITKDQEVLKQASKPFLFGEDSELIKDLIDTAEAHRPNCVGLAAIQLGVQKRAIVALVGGKFTPFINPTIVNKSHTTYVAEEGCLSLEGLHEVKRHQWVMVRYQTRTGRWTARKFYSREAQILQHEIDHCNGILI